MAIIRCFIALTVAAFLSGCSMAGVRGNYYMESRDYEEAEVEFQLMVEKDPGSAVEHYYLGRFLLAQDKIQEAFPHLQKAVAIDRIDSEYNFWLGVVYGEKGELKAERLQYERTLKLSRYHTRARLYLGHSQLRSGELTSALKSYDKVLKAVPTNAAALYNRALILELQKKRTNAKKAWREYLKWFPAGGHAIQAADHLNDYGDFSFENHFIGVRTVTLKEIRFQKRSASVSVGSLSSLRLLGAIVNNIEKGNLQIVVYDGDNSKSAQKKAIEVRKKILALSPGLAPERIGISWFDKSEVVIRNGKKHVRKSSIRLFLTDWK